MAEDLMDDGENEDSAGSFNEVDSISSGDDTTLDEESAPNSEPKVYTSDNRSCCVSININKGRPKSQHIK
jgi:hypothetical protein